MLLAGRDPNRVAGPDFTNRLAPQLHPADAGNDVQGLAERVSVPRGARVRLEPDPGTPDPRRRRRFDDRLLPYRAGERVGRAPARGHGAQSFDVHGCFSSNVALEELEHFQEKGKLVFAADTAAEAGSETRVAQSASA